MKKPNRTKQYTGKYIAGKAGGKQVNIHKVKASTWLWSAKKQPKT